MAGDLFRRAGVLMFAATAQFFIFFVIAESVYPGYSPSAQPISDLGATCRSGSCIIPPSSLIFDSTVFVLGALVFVAAFFLYIMRYRLVGGLTALSAWGVMGVAIFPETTGVIHTLVSLIAFLFGGLAAIASFRMARRPFGYFGVVLGAIGIISLVLYGSGTYLGLGQGGMERLVAYPELIWLAGFGASLMGRTDREDLPVMKA